MKLGSFEIDLPSSPLRSPHCIAILRPWINVGNVGHTVLVRLSDIYDAKEIGRLERPSSFYDFTRYRPEIRLSNDQRRISVPNTVVLAGRHPETVLNSHDLLFFHMLEPHANAEDFNDSVIDLLRYFNVERYTVIGGMYDAVPHSRPLLVSGSAHGWEPSHEFGDIEFGVSRYEGPTSLTSQIVNRVNDELGIETLSLIVRLPLYLKLENDYNGAYKILGLLSRLYGFSSDMPEKSIAAQQYEQVNPALLNNPQLLDLVKKYEDEYDSGSKPVSAQKLVQLLPEIEDFLEDVAKREKPENDVTSGGI